MSFSFYDSPLAPCAGFAIVIALWLGLGDVLGVLNPVLFPPLLDVLTRLKDITLSGSLMMDFFATLMRWGQGFGLGAFWGIGVGLALGTFPKLYRVCEGVIEFLRAMPVTAIFPLFLMIFGIGDASKIAMAFLPTFLLMLVNASYGVKHASPERRRVAIVFGANPFQVFRHVIFFEALPQIFIGLRMALSLSLIVTVVSEMFIGTETGLGQRIYDSYLTSSITTLYALLLVLGVLGYALNKISMTLEKRIVFWAGRV